MAVLMIYRRQILSYWCSLYWCYVFNDVSLRCVHYQNFLNYDSITPFGNLYHKLIFNPLWDILIDVGYFGMGYCVHWDILVWDILLWDTFVCDTLSCHRNFKNNHLVKHTCCYKMKSS